MPSDACERCGTESIGLRVDRLCIWCYAEAYDRPDDADLPMADAVGEDNT